MMVLPVVASESDERRGDQVQPSPALEEASLSSAEAAFTSLKNKTQSSETQSGDSRSDQTPTTDSHPDENHSDEEDEEDEDEVSSASTVSTPIRARKNVLPVPGSVMSAYLSDPVVNPAARSLFPSVDTRLDWVHSNRSTSGWKLNSLPAGKESTTTTTMTTVMPCVSSYPSTSAFISLVNDLGATMEETAMTVAACCEVSGIPRSYLVYLLN